MASMDSKNEQAQKKDNKEDNTDEQQNEGDGDERKGFKKVCQPMFQIWMMTFGKHEYSYQYKYMESWKVKLSV